MPVPTLQNSPKSTPFLHPHRTGSQFKESKHNRWSLCLNLMVILSVPLYDKQHSLPAVHLPANTPQCKIRGIRGMTDMQGRTGQSPSATGNADPEHKVYNSLSLKGFYRSSQTLFFKRAKSLAVEKARSNERNFTGKKVKLISAQS